MAAELRTKGFKQLARKVDKFKGEIKARAKRAVTTAVIDVHREAKTTTAFKNRTGRLRSSIRFEVREDGLAGEVFTDVFYGVFIELGTRFMDARPFLFPPFQKIQKQLVRDLKRI